MLSPATISLSDSNMNPILLVQSMPEHAPDPAVTVISSLQHHIDQNHKHENIKILALYLLIQLHLTFGT